MLFAEVVHNSKPYEVKFYGDGTASISTKSENFDAIFDEQLQLIEINLKSRKFEWVRTFDDKQPLLEKLEDKQLRDQAKSAYEILSKGAKVLHTHPKINARVEQVQSELGFAEIGVYLG